MLISRERARVNENGIGVLYTLCGHSGRFHCAGRRRELDAIVVWRLDRWGRSLLDLIATLPKLHALRVGFVSLSEALDMTTPWPRICRPARGVRRIRAQHPARLGARRHPRSRKDGRPTVRQHRKPIRARD
jgi:hypothetical protein